MKNLPFAEKYASRNPVSRYLVRRFIKSLSSLAQSVAPSSVLEIGCGEGFLALALGGLGYRVHGLDVREDALDYARKAAFKKGMEKLLSFEYGDIYNLNITNFTADLLVCCEVLEHLDEPDRALEALHNLPIRYAVFSVPREPLWRVLNLCRMKYVGGLGNTPGHVNHWSKSSFLSFLGTRYRVLDVSTPVPWTMALCERK